MTMPTDRATTRRRLLAAGALLPAALAAHADAGTAPPVPFHLVQPIPGGVRLRHGDRVVDVRFTTGHAVSVVSYPLSWDPARDTHGFFLSPEVFATDAALDGHVLRFDDNAVHIDLALGQLAFFRHGKRIISDTGAAPLTFVLAQAADLYGLGQFRDPLANYRDRSIYLAHANMDAVNPLLMTPHGLGLLWDTGTDAVLTSAGATLTYCHTSPLTRYHVLLADDMDGTIALYRGLTGTAPLLGKHAYGFWQSQERYHSQDELTGMVDAYRARGLPLDIIVQDWRYWGDNDNFSGMTWDPAAFPDPKAMCDRVHAQHAHVIASVWPAFGPSSAIFKDLTAANLLFKGEHWSGGKVMDMTSPVARDIYYRHIHDGLFSVGLDGLWTDGCEPEFMSTGNRYGTMTSYADNGDCAAGPIRDHLLTFSYYQTRLLYTRQKQDNPAKRPLTLSRSVYPGQQAFNAITWSGDIFAGWQTLKNQVLAAQQMSLSGLPYWTCDIGGFLVTHRFPDGLKDPAYLELYIRWFQFGAFLPVFRAHGTEIRREVWAIGPDDSPMYAALKAALEQRYSLMPYIYSQAARVTHHAETFLRPLVMDFAADPRIAHFPNQYMFGHDILVCVVTTPLEEQPRHIAEFIPNYAVDAEVTFYAGADFATAVDTRHSDDVKMSWSGDLPVALKGQPWSARWAGTITAEESGLHSFHILSQGLIRFTLDGKLRVASAGAEDSQANGADGAVSFKGHGGDDSYGFDLPLVKGRAYRFELTQSQPAADVVSLWLEWTTPSQRADMQVTPAKTIDVYLPAGTTWYDLATGVALAGGQTLKVHPQLAVMPTFVRAGAIIPMTPGIQYAAQTPDRVELHIYAGRDGAFSLYDDAGDGHGYEDGAFRAWPLAWDDAARTLTFRPASGTYGRDATRFVVILHDGGQGISRTVTVSPDQVQTVALS